MVTKHHAAPAEVKRTRLVSLVLAGASVTDAAASIGVSREYASRLLAQDDVRQALAEGRAEIARDQRTKLTAIHSRALQVVYEALNAETASLADALAVLKALAPPLTSNYADNVGAVKELEIERECALLFPPIFRTTRAAL